MSTFDVRIHKIDERPGKDRKTGKPRKTYRLRWQVAGKRTSSTFETKALADSFRAKLLTAQRQGVAFDEATMLPEPMARELNKRSWYEHAVAYVDMKWPRVSPNHRKGIAESLTGATVALLSAKRGAPPDEELRRALRTYAFNKKNRDAAPPRTTSRPP